MSALHIRPESLGFTIMLGLLAALPSLSIDISQPMLLDVQAQLHAPAGVVGLTITVFMLGFALGQFAGGPWSDQRGRRPVLLISLVVFIVAAVGCAGAGSAMSLLAWRFIQGVGSGACAVMAFTIIRDLFEGDAARAKRAYVIVVLGIAPLFSPALGAWVAGHLGWRLVYLLLAGGGVLLLLTVVVGLGESRPVPVSQPPRRLLGAYLEVMHDRRFMLLAWLNALSYGGIFAYIAGSPQVLMGTLAFTPTGYGVFFACTAAALTAGAFVSGRCTKAGVGPNALLWAGLPAALASAAALAGVLHWGVLSVAVVMPLLLVNMFCRGLTAPNAQHMALEPMREQAGTASAVVGVLQILVGAASSALVALLLPKMGPWGMGAVMAALSAASLLLWLRLTRAGRTAA